MATALKVSIFTIVYGAQAAFSAYNLYLASISISNLKGYEETSKKAAEYSNIAEHQLHKTRTTQASGTVAVLVSFVSSVSLMVYGPTSTKGKLLLAVGNAAALQVASTHVRAFGKGKKKLPISGLGDHNEATGNTQEMTVNMGYLVASWIFSGLLSSSNGFENCSRNAYL